MEKIGLVLEGGGMRGAYTAGVLHWLLQEKIEFDYIVGISSGALYGGMFALGKKDTLEKAAIEVAADKRNVGIRPILAEKTLVGYDFLYNTVTQELDYPITEMNKIPGKIDIGVYDIAGEKTIWIDKEQLAQDPLFIKAACTLPVAGRAVWIHGRKYMDGGITTMIPVQKSIDEGCTRHIVVTTKSADYVRKDQGFAQKMLLRTVYRKYPKLVHDFESRRDVYYEERELIIKLVDEKKATYIYPTQEVGVGRFKGSEEQFEDLFKMAHDDCELRRDEIMAMVSKD